MKCLFGVGTSVLGGVLFVFLSCFTSTASAEQPRDHLHFPGKTADSPHVVLVTGGSEYRSEEALPMLAKLLARGGFECTVLFSMDRKGKGFVDPGNPRSLPHSEAFDTADVIALATRFRLWPDEDMARFVAAFERGVGIVGLRTSQLSFHYFEDSPWKKYSWKNGHPKHWKHDPKEGWHYGFGMEVLGDRWIGHHGKHGVEGTRTQPIPEVEGHPILQGVGTIFVESDVYKAKPKKDCKLLLLGAVTESFDPKSPILTDRKNEPMQPVAWTRTYKHANGTANRVFMTTMGAATDLDDANLRRLVCNGIYWALDQPVPPAFDVSIIGDYSPSFYGGGKFRKNLRPSDYLNLQPKETP